MTYTKEIPDPNIKRPRIIGFTPNYGLFSVYNTINNISRVFGQNGRRYQRIPL